MSVVLSREEADRLLSQQPSGPWIQIAINVHADASVADVRAALDAEMRRVLNKGRAMPSDEQPTGGGTDE